MITIKLQEKKVQRQISHSLLRLPVKETLKNRLLVACDIG